MDAVKEEKAVACETATPQALAPAITDNGHLAHFLDPARYRHLQAVAKDFAASEIVPKRYQGKPCDCLIALELAARLGMHPLMVMQNVYTVYGTPGMQGQFVIALVNSSGVFAAPLEWEYAGDGDSRTCVCRATRRADGKAVQLTMSIAIAKAEGWFSQNAKWKNIPDQMLAYRSASWLARLHCPEVLMGLQTVEEIADVIDITPLLKDAPADPSKALQEAAKSAGKAAQDKKSGDGTGDPAVVLPEIKAGPFTCPKNGNQSVPRETCLECPAVNGCPEHD